MALSAEQVQLFKKQGYLSVPHFFDSREVAALQADVERLRREGILNNVATDGDGKTVSKSKVNLQICPMSPKSTLIRALPFESKVISAVTSLIGDRILLHLDQCFLKPAQHGSGTNWHQDNAYFQIADPWKGVAMWIAVHDATVANGTIHVIPDLVHAQLPHQKDPESNHHIRCYPPEERAVPLELPAGGVAFFAYGVPHSTRGNTTLKDRAGIAFHFLHEEYATTEEFTKRKYTPRSYPVLSGPNAKGGVDAYGERVAGTWSLEIERALENGKLQKANGKQTANSKLQKANA